jgi:putative acetyltransferase
MGLGLRRTDGGDPAYVLLTRRLDDELWSRYGRTPPAYERQADFVPDAVVVASEDDLPVGCAGFRRRDAATIQLARMYVAESRRGQGVGRAIVRELEAWAIERGAVAAVVEVGLRQPEIVELYEATGYRLIDATETFGAGEQGYALRKTLRRS